MDFVEVGTPRVPRESVLPVTTACLACLAWLFRAPLFRALRYRLRRVR